jgi:fermentation-respiration switch protein FrsA (DUF1100 family)
MSSKPSLHWAWRAARSTLLIVLLVAAFFMWFETRLIYFPEKYPAGYYGLLASHAEARDVELVAADGTRLHGWFLPVSQPVATFVFCHGNAGNLTHRVDIAEQFAGRGIQTLLFDYRGYGRSQGEPDEAGLLLDGAAALAWARSQPDIDPRRIFLYAESLGGGVATVLAAEGNVAGLILQSCFRSMRGIARDHYPIIHLLTRTRFDNESVLRRVEVPVLIVHGRRDTLIDFRHAQALFDAAHEPKWLFPVPEAEHNDIYEGSAEITLDRIRGFIDQALPTGK